MGGLVGVGVTRGVRVEEVGLVGAWVTRGMPVEVGDRVEADVTLGMLVAAGGLVCVTVAETAGNEVGEESG